MLRYFSFIFIFLITNLKAYQIKYDPNIEDELSTRYSIRTICPIKEDSDDEAGEEEEAAPPIELNLTFEGPTYYDQGDTDACTFFARVCGMLFTERGRDHLQSLFLGQNDHFVYVKFPTPSLPECTNDEAMATNLGKVYFLRDTVFKVSRSVIIEHKPLSDFSVPPWFRILAAAYHDAFNYMRGQEENEELSTDDAQILLSNTDKITQQTGSTNVELLTGRPQGERMSIKAMFDNKTFPKDFDCLLDQPLLNFTLAHVRAVYISPQRVDLFDSQSDEKGVVTSKMFDARVSMGQVQSFIAKSQEHQSRYFDLVTERFKVHANDTVDDEIKTKIDQELEQTIDNTIQLSRRILPPLEGYKPIELLKLLPDEFFTRLYAELIMGCFFEIQALDLTK